MYDYYADILAEEYTLSQAIMWLLPDGNKERGLRRLRDAATDGRYVKTEAIYFLAKIHYLYEDDYRGSRKWTTRLRERHPNNPFFHALEGRVYARWGRWNQARTVFRSVLERCEAGEAGYNTHMEEIARLYLARDRLYQDQYQDALRHLAELEQLTSRDIEDTRYRMLGYLYQGMVYDALGNRNVAVNRYRKVLDMEDAAGAHDRAEDYLDSPYEG
jgi:tetratricopeptide (TPR) repeat protein